MSRGHFSRARLHRTKPLSLDRPRTGDDDARRDLEEHRPAAASAASLGPYRVLEPLGQGGMGVVYRARHSVTERAVAVKTVRVSAPRWIESIRREIDALTRIRHPGIVRIVDHGVHEGRPWYAMDLLEGESLGDFCARVWSPFRTSSAPPGPLRPLTVTAPLSQSGESLESLPTPRPRLHAGDTPAAAGALPQVLGLMRRLCATLAFLHGEGIVSCDLKPENILLVGSTPVLIDFGLSRRFPASTGREAMDAQRSMAGTLPYMSPEQARGELVDARSDLYAVGCILYELLTGAPPFTGAPFTIRMLHQSAAPSPPSQIVRDLPKELEALVLRLLEKEPNDRVGFADEVAFALGEISGDSQRLHDFPPARPYLYRPRFVGRADTLGTLAALRDAACEGSGALALVGGESGVGKTRLALELTRSSATSSLRVIASESLPIASEQVATATASPLHIVRPLLRAIADRCQEGGAEVTERLLGVRRSVLAMYEPLLAEVPAAEPLTPVVPLAPQPSRERLLRYVAQSFTEFALEQPILWILDDLGWADDLSLAFLQSLTPEYFSTTPALLLGTYRSEEATDAVRALAGLAHVAHLTLAPLREDEVSAMVADMLAAPAQHTGFAAYVAVAAEGNPFFVTEHVRTAVDERLFYRDQDYAWRMRAGEPDGGRAEYEDLPLPKSLRSLVEHRLRALSDLAQGAARAAAVLGREFAADVMAEVAELSPEAAVAAINELVRRQMLEQRSPEHLRFVHDKLREVAYGGSPENLRAIHGRAALALERRVSAYADSWAVLGHHFAAASQPEPAARYLRRAADHARANFANAEAIVLCRRAIAQMREVVLEVPNDAPAWQTMLLEMREALGDVLALGAGRDEARTEYAEALKHGDESDVVRVARLHRKIGKTWESEHRHDEALRLYRSALAAVADTNEGSGAGEWLQASLDELWVHYWQGKLAEMQALSARLQSAMQQSATALQRSNFMDAQMKCGLVQNRFRVDQETLDYAAGALLAAEESGDVQRIVTTRFNLGFARVFFGDFDSGITDLQAARSMAERTGDLAHQVRALSYLAVAARMKSDRMLAEAHMKSAAEIASRAQMKEYVALARANQAWAAEQAGDTANAEQLANSALDIWRGLPVSFPFEWLALVPLLRIHLKHGDVSSARARILELQAPRQHALPGPASEALHQALAAADHTFAAGAHVALRILADASYQ